MKSGASSVAFESGVHLPVVGDKHPLRQRYRKILIRAAITGAMLHVLGFGGWLAWRTFKPEPEYREGPMRIVKLEMGVPPSLSQETGSAQLNVAAQVAPPSIGIPEPVPDFQAEVTTIATATELSEMLTPTDLSSLGSGMGDSLVVEFDADSDPSADEFVAYEDPPVLINLPPPDYPELAKRAEMEGTVMVRALVGKDGKVKDAFAAQSVPMLDEAAIDAVKRASFKPALQQQRPVAVWVQVPIRFDLN